MPWQAALAVAAASAAAAGPAPLPQLDIVPGGIAVAGGDMAIQFHVAFSESVAGVCGYDAQPYHCAATKFSRDAPYSADHCRAHPEWVDVGKLPDYPRRTCGNGGKKGCLDDVVGLYNTSVYLAHTNCSAPADVVVNTAAMYAQMLTEPQAQSRYVDKCGAPGGDAAAECLATVFAGLAPPAAAGQDGALTEFDQTPFVDESKSGLADQGWIYVPQACQAGGACRLAVLFHGPGGCADPPPANDTYSRYAEGASIVLLRPCAAPAAGGAGGWDSSGALGSDYCLQSGAQMRAVWGMVRRVARLAAPAAAKQCVCLG